MTRRRLVVAGTDAAGGADAAFGIARERLHRGDEVVYVGISDVEAIARAAVAEDASLVLVAGAEEAVAAVRRRLDELEAEDVEVVGADGHGANGV